MSPPQLAIEAQLRQRLELQLAHKDYMELKERKREAEKEEEEEFRRQMMAKFAEDDRIEQMNAQKRRMKQLGWYSMTGVYMYMYIYYTCTCMPALTYM